MNFSEAKSDKLAFAGLMLLAFFVFVFDLNNREPLGYEFRHAAIVKQMLKEGFSWIPRLFDVPYAQKPPFLFWLIYPLAKLAGGVKTWTLALPSALAAVGTVALLYRFLRRFDGRWALYACLILMTTYPFQMKARMSTIDVVLGFFVTLTLVSFYACGVRGDRRGWVGMAAGLLFGWLTKGPVAVVLPAGVILSYWVWKREWRKAVICGAAFGAVLAILFAAWYGACFLLLGEEYVKFSIQSQTYGRFLEKPKNYLFYFAVVAVFSLPWSLPLFGALRRKMRREPNDPLLFALIWFGVTFALFTAAADKHLRYFMPAFPPMAAVAASYFVRRKGGPPEEDFFWRWARRGVWGALIVLAAGSAAFLFAEGLPEMPQLPRRYAVCAAALAVFAGLEVRRRRRAQKFGWPSLAAGMAGVLLFNSQFIDPAYSYAKSPKELVLKFEGIARRQNPLGMHKIRRDDIFRYMHYSFRTVYPMPLPDAEEIPATMRFMKYRRGLVVTYLKYYKQWPEEVKKDCRLLLEEKFRGKTWVLVEWKDPL